MILKIFNTGVFGVNTYVLIDEKSKEALIIDLGGDFEKINKYIKEQNANLKFILNTHGHFDHIMGDVDVQTDKIKVPVYMHKDDLDHAENISQTVKDLGFADEWKKITIDHFLDENSDIKLGNIPIKIFHTPGHTKGGVSYLIEDKVFVGDTLFNNSIGRTDFAYGDFNTLINSIKTKLMPLDNNITVYPGHGPSTTIGEERLHNPYLQ
ncbi:MAG: MBL fold metallo-hydrolase [Candidatus Gastranaerophilales bacterium]|nr:MBL fold metallo-hydrolase [Candidatus Gastranaerophilales bacterium]